MIGKLLFAAALLVPGVASARDVAELECLRGASTEGDRKAFFDATMAQDQAGIQAMGNKVQGRTQGCIQRYNWTPAVQIAAGAYVGLTMLLDYSRSELAKRDGIIAKLDAAVASMPAGIRAQIEGNNQTQDALGWLRATTLGAGLTDGPGAQRGLAYLVSGLQRKKRLEDWKAL